MKRQTNAAKSSLENEEQTVDEVSPAWTTETLDRIATQVADGGVPFPTDVTPLQGQILAEAVRRLFRERLLQYIAHAIAVDIWDNSLHKETVDVKESF